MMKRARRQTTLAGTVRLSDIGVHSGAPVGLTLHPASTDHGITFVRSDLDDRIVVPARHNLVSDTSLCTVVGVQPGPGVSTVEHLMAALSGLGVTNVRIEVDGPEMPILDGSAACFVEAIEAIGVVQQSKARRAVHVLKPVSVTIGRATATLEPYDGFRIEGEIAFDDAVIGRQSFIYDENETDFAAEIASARTFGFLKDVEAIRAAGLAKGASLKNTVVVGERAVENPEGLRFANEFARHKVLDAIGDLALSGYPLRGLYRATRPGHRLNHAILTTLFSTPGAWVLAEDSDAEFVFGGAAAITRAAFAPEI